jgi:hyperosmotically inducible periplasmic protein
VPQHKRFRHLLRVVDTNRIQKHPSGGGVTGPPPVKRARRLPKLAERLAQLLSGKTPSFGTEDSKMTQYKFIRATLCAMLGTGLLHGCALTGSESTPKGDARITAAVKAAIDKHPDLGPPNQIYVDTRDRVVYLSGTVDDGLVAQNAVSVARGVRGVSDVVNNVSVDK